MLNDQEPFQLITGVPSIRQEQRANSGTTYSFICLLMIYLKINLEMFNSFLKML